MRAGPLRARMITTAILICCLVLPLAPAHAEEQSYTHLTGQQALGLIDCIDLDGKLFCTELGFVAEAPTAATLQEAFDAEGDSADTGDVSLHNQRVAVSELPEAERELAWAQQVVSAHDARPRITLIEHLSGRIPLPTGFFDSNPQLGISEAGLQADALRARAATGEPLDPALFIEPDPALQEQPSADDPTAQAADRPCRPPDDVDLGPELERAYEIVRQRACPVLPEAGDSELTVPPPRSGAVEAAEDAADDPSGFAAAAGEGKRSRTVYIGYDSYRKQLRDYWCGPATMQSIDGMDDGGFDSQATWSKILGTESDQATSITKLVEVINSHTRWDTGNRGGRYVEYDTNNMGARRYYDFHVDTLNLYRRPIVNHVRLERQFFNYFRYDHSGHLQTVRGFNYNNGTLSYFQPYNEVDFRRGGASTGSVHYQHYSSIYGANQRYAALGQDHHVDMGI